MLERLRMTIQWNHQILDVSAGWEVEGWWRMVGELHRPSQSEIRALRRLKPAEKRVERVTLMSMVMRR